MTGKKRRGRKRKPGIARTASGRISRAAEDPTVTDVAIEARQRVFGIPVEHAKDQLAGTVLGRLLLAGKISAKECGAGYRLAEWHGGMLRAIQASDPLAKQDRKAGFVWELAADPTKDAQQQDYVDWATRLVARWEVAKDWLGQRGEDAKRETIRVAIDGYETLSLPALRLGLGYIAERMGVMTEEATAAAADT